MRKVFSRNLSRFAVGIVGILLLSCMLVPLGTGCSNEAAANNNSEGEITMPKLDKETELLIKKAYLVSCFEKSGGNVWITDDAFRQIDGQIWTIRDVVIFRYCGMYNGCAVVLIGGCGWGFAQVCTTRTVADIAFEYGDANQLRVLKSGVFFTLEEAYSEKLIAKDDLLKIAEVFHAR